ncbi:MAG: N-acetylmuramoyl-L-alanine amidase [Myxococcales bacterium]
MLWSKVDKKWQDRLGKTSDGDVTWKTEQWPVPGEEALEIRVCSRAGVAQSTYCETAEKPRTSIVLHQTEGYGQQLAWLMGGAGHPCSAHVQLGRCGTPYLLVPTEFTAWHATWWNGSSIGIEIDCIGELYKNGDNLVSQYGAERKDVYCAVSEKDVYVEKDWGCRTKYWASLTEKQYLGLGRLIKALCFKHKIPRILLPEPQRYKPFDPKDSKARANYRGICTHLNIDPARKVDIGPYLDWAKLIQYAGLTEADCFNPPNGVLETWKNETGGAVQKADAPSTSTSKPPAGGETLPAPVMIDNHTLRVHVGKHGGRLCLSVKQPGDPLPTAPDPTEAPAAKAPGKRDDFIQACMNFLGAPYKAGSKKPAEGIDGVNMIAIAMRRVELFKSDDEMPTDHEHLSALWHVASADPKKVPEEILPGDLVWFGMGDHGNDPLVHPMVYLGGGRVLGPVPDGGANTAVQVIAIDKVPEHFAGWMHVDDLGTETKHAEHPGDPPPAGAKLTGALLPPTPAAQYDALKKIVERAKGKWEDGKGKVNLVGVKSMHDRCMISPKPDDWNDTLFAAFLDDAGNKCVLDMRASLNPGTDSNKAETWQLWEGSWKFKLGAGDSVDKALQPDGKVKGWEDKEGMGAPRPLDHDKPAKGDDIQPGAPKGTGDEKPPAPKKPIEAKDAKPAPPPDKPFVFDAAAKKLSMKFGMRMMRALIEWELKEDGSGTLYSWNGVVKKYPKLAPKRGNEWPVVDSMMQIKPSETIDYNGRTYGVWRAFGVEWVATGATNCCNSQMAAVFASLPDGKMRIKKDSGVLELDVVKGEPVAEGIKGNDKTKYGYSSVFANTWIQGEGSHIRTDAGKRIFENYAYIAPAWAMKWLGVGDAVGKWGDAKSLVNVRMGDNACWFSHNWLVGDVRYEVTLKGYKTPVYVDQSDFARGDHPQPHAGPARTGGYKMTREDCLFVEQNEELFEARLKAFLDLKTLEYDGKDYDVTKITPVGARVFSANCMAWQKYGTARGVIYSKADGTDGSNPEHWIEEATMTKQNKLGLGISRGWGLFADNYRDGSGCFGFARWYDNAGGADNG